MNIPNPVSKEKAKKQQLWACPKCKATCTREACGTCGVCDWRNWGENASNNTRMKA